MSWIDMETDLHEVAPVVYVPEGYFYCLGWIVCLSVRESLYAFCIKAWFW